MEINKQLFEDVLLGKLEGNFVLKNGFRINSNRLCKEVENTICPYWLKGLSSLYTREGIPNSTFMEDYTIVDFIPKPKYKTIDLEMLEYCRKDFDFMKTLSKAINNMNTLEIEIPPDKEIDWKESEKQNKIVLKDKQLTYEDVCKKLFNGETYYTNTNGKICSSNITQYVTDPNNATTEHQLKCILAKNKLANVAKYLNDGWKPTVGYTAWYIISYGHNNIDIVDADFQHSHCSSRIIFKTKELAEKAIEILGRETVKLALEPLGI